MAIIASAVGPLYECTRQTQHKGQVFSFHGPVKQDSNRTGYLQPQIRVNNNQKSSCFLSVITENAVKLLVFQGRHQYIPVLGFPNVVTFQKFERRFTIEALKTKNATTGRSRIYGGMLHQVSPYLSIHGSMHTSRRVLVSGDTESDDKPIIHKRRLSHNRQYKSGGDVGFFGVIIDFSDTGVVVYTPMGVIVDRRREDIIKVRLIPMARQWRGALLAQALRTGVIGRTSHTTGEAETEIS